jgi:1-deoxy-D-xylulose-5-phosphate synthase
LLASVGLDGAGIAKSINERFLAAVDVAAVGVAAGKLTKRVA